MVVALPDIKAFRITNDHDFIVLASRFRESVIIYKVMVFMTSSQAEMSSSPFGKVLRKKLRMSIINVGLPSKTF